MDDFQLIAQVVLPNVFEGVAPYLESVIIALGKIVTTAIGGYFAYLVILKGLRWSHIFAGFGPKQANWSAAWKEKGFGQADDLDVEFDEWSPGVADEVDVFPVTFGGFSSVESAESKAQELMLEGCFEDYNIEMDGEPEHGFPYILYMLVDGENNAIEHAKEWETYKSGEPEDYVDGGW